LTTLSVAQPYSIRTTSLKHSFLIHKVTDIKKVYKFNENMTKIKCSGKFSNQLKLHSKNS